MLVIKIPWKVLQLQTLHSFPFLSSFIFVYIHKRVKCLLQKQQTITYVFSRQNELFTCWQFSLANKRINHFAAISLLLTILLCVWLWDTHCMLGISQVVEWNSKIIRMSRKFQKREKISGSVKIFKNALEKLVIALHENDKNCAWAANEF